MSAYSVIRNFQFKQPIIRANYHESKYYVIDSQNTLHILDDACVSKLKMKLIRDKDELHHYSHNYSIAKGIISIAKANSVMCAQYKDEKVKVVYKKEHASKDIIYTVLNKSAGMLLSCSIDGKASILNTISKFYCYTFDYQPDYCSSAFFSNRDIFVYIGYFNLENRILNLKDLSTIEFQLKNPIESGVFFDDDTKLFLADRAGNSIIYDCLKKKIISTKALFNEWVSCTTLYNEKYVLVGTRKNKLYILNAFENELMASIDLGSQGVTSINIADEKLLITYADATFEIIELDYLKESFVLHLNLQEYKEAKDILDQNLFLYIDKSIEKFEKGFLKVITKTKELISKGEIEAALELVEPFMNYKKFKNELEMLFMQQDHIAKFIEAVEKNDISTAYALADKYHVILTLGTYQILERYWDKAFGQAKKVIESDNLHGKNKAKTILETYMNVTQKSELIKQLITNSDKFALADKFVKEQNFEKYFDLINRFSFLQDTLLYKKIDTLASSLKSKAQQAVSNDNIEEAIKIYKQLIVFPQYSEYAKKNIYEINTKIELENFIESDKMELLYKHVEKYPYLAYENTFLIYNSRFEEELQNAQHHIEKKIMSMAIKTVSKYFSIQYLDNKIANLFKHAYLLELEENNIKEYDIVKTVLGYKQLFGIDDEIKEVFKNKQMEDELKYALKSNTKINIEKYPETILAV